MSRDVADERGVRLCARRCDTCVFRPGNLIHLAPGRLRGMVEDWRTRARGHEREANGLLRSLVGAVEDLRALRTLTPRWFLAVRRGERAIDLHRRRHLTR